LRLKGGVDWKSIWGHSKFNLEDFSFGTFVYKGKDSSRRDYTDSSNVLLPERTDSEFVMSGHLCTLTLWKGKVLE
jgi:hypothetical protein